MQRVSISRFGRARVSHFALALGLILACTPATQQTPDPSVPEATAGSEGAPSTPGSGAGSAPASTAEGQPLPLERAAGDDSEPGWGIVEPPAKPVTYAEVVRRVTSMVNDGSTQAEVARRGLHLINLTWEDTGRDQGSALGPNISDLTLQVRHRAGRQEGRALPVIRFPNFSDRTGDVRADKFFCASATGQRRRSADRGAPATCWPNVKAYLSDPVAFSAPATSRRRATRTSS